MGLFILIQKCIINLKIYHLGVKNMNDKSIRNILISYIKASNNEVRNYQEKISAVQFVMLWLLQIDYVKETNFDPKEYSNDFVLPFKSKKICGFEFCEPEI